MKYNWTVLAYVSPCWNDDNQKRQLPKKHSKINPFVVKSVAEPHCKRFSKSAIRESFNLNLTRRWKKILPFNDATIFTNTMKKKRKVANFLQDLCASEKVQVFSISRGPEIRFWHHKGHQWESALISFNEIFQRITTAVIWGRQQNKVNFEKNWKTEYLVVWSKHRTMPSLFAR